MRIVVALLLVCLAACSTNPGPNPNPPEPPATGKYQFTVVVFDPSGAFVEGAHVYVWKPDGNHGEIQEQALTNANGFASLLLPQKSYTVTVGKDGFQDETFNVELTAHFNRDVRLKR